MLAPPVLSTVAKDYSEEDVLSSEREFYETYDWCLNPYLTVHDAVAHVREEVDKLVTAQNGWQTGEIVTNIFLLSSGLLNCVDEYLLGHTLRLPKPLVTNPIGRAASRFMKTISNRPWSWRRAARWREHWFSSLNDLLSLVVQPQNTDSRCLVESGRTLTMLLESTLPVDLQAKPLNPPSPFNHLDLTPTDVLRLGERLVRRFPDRTQPLLLLGLRTSGSYFVPLLRALLETKGYRRVTFLTVNPTKGVAAWEHKKLKRFAADGYCALITDDPPHTCSTLLRAIGIAFRAGFARHSVKLLAPTHPAYPSWFKTLPDDTVITLPPEQWHKQELLSPETVKPRLAEYFRSQNLISVSVSGAKEFNSGLRCTASDERFVRLKRIFEVQLQTPQGEIQTRYVLAKSVGWGWLSYRAFLIGKRLRGHVPPILGLRDGILYMEWIPQAATSPAGKRHEIIDAAASYVAARVRHLPQKTGAGMDLKQHNNGVRLLEKALSRAYGRFPTDILMRSPLGARIRQTQCPCPTLIDGNMHRSEWISGPNGSLKVDYEHHGMGKNALNVTDPAYDLADAILNLALSSDEESDLIQKYIDESGDVTVNQRLFMNKLLAGLWAMSEAQARLISARGRDAQLGHHLRFISAWNFLTVHTARHFGSLCHSGADLRWRSPLIALDVDGVLDRRLFGFPCTTVAGMKALSLLSKHEFSVVLNTARSAAEVRDYCKAYSLAGGIAEHGSYLWDAVHQRERVLIGTEAQHQLAELRRSLQRMPGVFLDERHLYSIRAFTYQDRPQGFMHSLVGAARASSVGNGALAPIASTMMQQLLAELRLDQLEFHHTLIDTTIVAKDLDKGTGLTALRDWVLGPNLETIAIGDTEHDLAMFRVASRSFAPSNIGCRSQAQLFGCRVTRHPYQQGLLEIVRKIIHPDNSHCERCSDRGRSAHRGDDLILSALHAADQSWTSNLLRATLDPTALKILFH
jgi:hydroxymethylpyrimidine pyrophosphatase-like HAD family hydrolase